MNQASEVLVSVRASLGDFLKHRNKVGPARGSNLVPESGVDQLDASSSSSPRGIPTKDENLAVDMDVEENDSGSSSSGSVSSRKSNSEEKESVLYGQNGFRKGMLELIRMCDVNYIVIFKGISDRSHSSDVLLNKISTDVPLLASSDLEDVRFIDQWNSLVFLDSGLMVNVINKVEFDIIKTARDECATISKLTLRLGNTARDAFFAGYHSTLHRVRKKGEPIEEELVRSNKAVYDFANQHDIYAKVKHLFQNVSNKSMGLVDTAEDIPTGRGGARKGRSKGGLPRGKGQGIALPNTSEAVSVAYLHGLIKCIYCEAEKRMPAFNNTEFIVHPYCPMTHSKEIITMCMPCATNWGNYRANLKSTLGLVLPGEFNEELCALCSDTPEELLMCSFCPRSYCNPCLTRSLKPHMLEQLHKEKDADWACQACANGVGARGAIIKSKWKVVTEDSVPSLPFPSASSSSSWSASSTQSSAVVLPLPVSLPLPTAAAKSNPEKDSVPAFGQLVMSPKKKGGSASKGPAAPLKVSKDMSEERYFAQYILHVDSLYDNAEKAGLPKSHDMFCTDDACFLCKDGGDLIECDWKRSFGNKRGSCHCRKVYHEYCLAYAVPDGKTWICPRHYCDGCASQNLAYMCKYCPVSSCDTCLASLAETYGNNEYAPLPLPPYGWEDSANVQLIVCHTCLRMFEKCLLGCADLITPAHPVFSAPRHLAAEDLELDEEDMDGTMFNKSAAPISMPGRNQRGGSRKSNGPVRKKEEVLDYLKRPGQSKRKRGDLAISRSNR